MSMKRSFELSISPSHSFAGRTLVVAGVLSLAVACARKDAAKTDSAAASTDTTKTASSMTATPSSPVESVSTGETTVSAESKANPTVAASNVSSGKSDTASKAASTTTKTASTSAKTPVHHTTHHSASAPATTLSNTASNTSSSTNAGSTVSNASSTTASTAAADTGDKAADTTKKTASAGGTTDHLLVSPQEYEGWKMFSVYCYRCHGVDAMGGGIAPNLRHSVSSEGSVTHDVFITTVTNGRLDKGMPTWKALLSPEQMEDLWLYINARSSGRLAPGRPHMASGANP